ncbi:aminoglycoside phosphotransferase family protein [Deinococcus taeanensis]|uniref:aminoglycoside phosphotransferase family protein n=1 Tax=Deinococcus taeanensis TaxID=2737050 RepID=UPI001CDBEC85|nr:aminoglycoside phosphotransferase family protein [Deinococcus taeanensis]UBV42928.1 aminoglycoside phosphotransferase family protein [Deinococcus taeanensis]
MFTDRVKVLRVARPAEAQLGMQAQIQLHLSGLGLPAAPVLRQGTLPGGQAFTLELQGAGDGQPPSPAGWGALGRVLGTLHALTGPGSGRLLDRSEGPLGSAATPELGVLSRLPEVWPLGSLPLRGQPLTQGAPDLWASLARQEAEVRRVVRQAPGLVHTDLHGGQLVWRRGRLAALLDFGDAARGVRVWDVASIALFHGWRTARHVAGAAGGLAVRDAAAFGLLLAQHRARLAQNQAARERAAAYVWSCLARIR